MFWLLFDVALFSIAIWAVLFLVRGGFWRADQMLDSETLDAFKPKNPGRWPSVVAIVPARNEADTIAEIVRAHARTDYPGDYGLIVVDDHSTDGTGELARAAGAETAPPVHVVSPPDLEPGWSG
ncbi:MAG: glycosyltransferase, partial [Pseudomonadota bacterium]